MHRKKKGLEESTRKQEETVGIMRVFFVLYFFPIYFKFYVMRMYLFYIGKNYVKYFFPLE